MLSAVMSITPSFQASDVTAQQSEEWSWTNGIFEYRNGQILIKEQSVYTRTAAWACNATTLPIWNAEGFRMVLKQCFRWA